MINLIAVHIQRFFSYLSAFTFGMLVLICGGNFFVMFVGWEMIGVVSYLLINFYFTRIQANKASILAFTMNRQGDMLLSIGFFAIFALFGSLNYTTVFSLVPSMNETAITIIALLLFGGASAKSAQIPLHSWLPGSMEAPTPVSALLHAATLVTAGIYLLLRSSPILEYSSTALLIITLIGASTAFFAATCGLVQNDLKRIIAMSTISQLGYLLILALIFIFTNLDYITNFDNSIIITIIFPLSISNKYSNMSFNFIFRYQQIKFISYTNKNINSPEPVQPNKLNIIDEVETEPNNFQSSALTISKNHTDSNGELSDGENDKISIFLNSYRDKYMDFSYSGRSAIKEKFNKIPGIYLWLNNINNKSYVGKSVNIYQRLSKYFSKSYTINNKKKMAICGAIDKYGINNFTFYVLEIINTESLALNERNGSDFLNLSSILRERENYWYSIIKPSYNIQSILQPFSGTNHYRFGKTVPEDVKLKISNTLKGRIVSEEVRANHIAGSKKKTVYCYDLETGKYLMEFTGIRIAARALNLKDSFIIRYRMDKNKPLVVEIEGKKYNILFKSSKNDY